MELGPRQLAWIEALESGRYRQTDGKLRRDTGFCCLGVLCDLYDESLWRGDDTGNYLFCNMSEIPSGEVTIWAGLRQADGTPCLSGEEEEEKDRDAGPLGIDSLIDMNDKGVSFTDIAKILRQHPDLYFEESK